MRNLPNLHSPPGSALCTSILVLGRAATYEEILVHGKQTPWFVMMHPIFFGTDGILCNYNHQYTSM